MGFGIRLEALPTTVGWEAPRPVVVEHHQRPVAERSLEEPEPEVCPIVARAQCPPAEAQYPPAEAQPVAGISVVETWRAAPSAATIRYQPFRPYTLDTSTTHRGPFSNGFHSYGNSSSRETGSSTPVRSVQGPGFGYNRYPQIQLVLSLV